MNGGEESGPAVLRHSRASRSRSCGRGCGRHRESILRGGEGCAGERKRQVDGSGRVPKNGVAMPSKLSDKKLAVLGAGKLGGILLRAYLKQGLFKGKNVTATVKHGEKAAALAKELGVAGTSENPAARKGGAIVLLVVKPQEVAAVLKEIAPEMAAKAGVIWVAGGVPTGYLEQLLGDGAVVVRAMPNTPAMVGCGMTGICRGAHAGPEHLEVARAMFDAVGRTVVVDEK